MHRQKILRHPQSHCQESYKNIKLHNCKVYAEDLAQTHKKTGFVSSVSVSPMNPAYLNPCAVFLWCPLLFQYIQPFLPVFCGVLLVLHSVWLWVSGIYSHQFLGGISLMALCLAPIYEYSSMSLQAVSDTCCCFVLGLRLDHSLAGHSDKFCITFIPAHLIGRAYCKLKIL